MRRPFSLQAGVKATRQARVDRDISRHKQPPSVSLSSRLYYAGRIYLHKKRWALRYLQVIRGLWILGPLRSYAVRYYRSHSRNAPLIVNCKEVFQNLEVQKVVDELNAHGYSSGVYISEKYINEITAYCDNARLAKYWNPHRECEAIDSIARNRQIVEVARRYLGAEPILWLTQLRWSFGNPTEQQKVLPSLHAEPLQYDGDAFHYDTLDFKSLTVFIYLTDVNADSGPHVVVEGTQRKSFIELWQIILNDTAALLRFGNRIKIVTGQRGSVLFEETSSYHKAARCKTNRLMLSIDYVLQRKPPPERPLVGIR